MTLLLFSTLKLSLEEFLIKGRKIKFFRLKKVNASEKK